MAASEKDRPSLYENLIKQGVSREQIERVHRDLRGRGYGEEEARKRTNAQLERVKALPEPKERRAEPPVSRPAHARIQPPNGPQAEPQPSGPLPPGAAIDAQLGKRAIDWLPDVPAWLRRRINRYAYRNGFLITRLAERIDDFWSVFDPSRADYASRALLRLLAERRGYVNRSPWGLSFIDDLDALRDSARRLLGSGTDDPDSDQAAAKAETEAVARGVRAREPFALEFFGEFTQPQEMLSRSLEYLAARYETGGRARVAELARVVKDGCRLIAVTEAVERDKLELLFDVVRAANASLHPGEESAAEIADAESLFRAAYQNLAIYGHELYPALLKMIASFYPEEEASPEKRARVLAFLGLREDQVLTWRGWQEKMRAQRERALQEQRARELERLEQEKLEQLSNRFEGILSTLMALFPESGIDRMEQGEFVLPFFANRVFRRTALFKARLEDLERVSSVDAMGLIMVLHAILDDLLTSLEPYALETVLGRETLAGELIALRGMWEAVSTRLFEPYLDEIREYAREVEGDPQFVKIFRESQRARNIEERINRLRNRAVRDFGHVVTDTDPYEGPKLYELAARLAEMAADVGRVVNQGLLSAEDPVRRKIAADLARGRLVDFIARSQTSSPDYRPVTRQIRRWAEARYRESVLDIPQKAQIAFVDVFRGIAELYDYILNDPKSFAAKMTSGVVIATSEDRERWLRERGERGRNGAETLQAALLEEFPGQHADALTGLKNKDYFLNELPKQLARLRAQHKPLTFLMIDIDHFKWVNDELGHPRGDDVLKSTAGVLLDNIRDGDLAIRYGGEELLVVVPSDLHTGIILAERLRHAQEQGVRARDVMRDVREIEQSHGEPCGTLSIGVADVTSVAEIGKAVERSDRALYQAKKTRNCVVFVDPSKETVSGDAFTTYTEYEQKARGASA
ncbi:MAG TPA: diguanylate cyclase [Spirochaetia bacterium]|nr:diguanylate cyclase [Spirochaetia bacterium]